MRALIRSLFCVIFLGAAAIAAQGAPTVTAITPQSGSNLGNEFVTITGTGFVATPTVTIGGVSCTSVTFVSSTTITCITGAHAAAVVDVVVTNPDMTSGTLAAGFTYRTVPPVCLITGTVFNPDNTVAANQLFVLSRILLSGKLIAQGPFYYETNGSGLIFNATKSGSTYTLGSTQGIIIQQGATASLYSPVPPWNSQTLAGVTIQIPASATADLGSLGTIAAVPLAGITVQNNGVNLPNKEGTLNAGNGLQVTETSPGTALFSLSTTAGLVNFGGISTNLQTAFEALPYGISAGNTGEVRFYELAANGSNYIGWKAPDNIPASFIWKWPSADGTNGQALITHGDGTTGFGNIASTLDAISAPVSNVSLNTGLFTLTFTAGNITGSNPVWVFQDSSPATGTGPLFNIKTIGSSMELPLQVTAQGTANGFKVDIGGIIRPLGSGGIDAAGIITGTLLAARLSGPYTGITQVGALTAGSLGSGFTPVGTAQGGLGANEGSASGILSLNSGVVVNNSVTANGVGYGGAGNALSFTGAAPNNNLFGSNGSGIPGWITVTSNLVLSGSTLDAAQNIQTSSATFQVAAAGFGTSAPTIGGGIAVIGPTLNSQGNSIQAAEFGGLINPTTNLTATYNVIVVDPTLNATGGSNGRTVNLISTNPTVTNAIGLTVNLLNLNYGTNKANIDSTGAMTLATSLAIGGGSPLTTTNTSGSGSLAMTVNAQLQTPTIVGAITFPSNVRQTFAPGSTAAGFNWGSVAIDPSSPNDGDGWYNSATSQYKGRANGSVVVIGGAGQVFTNQANTYSSGLQDFTAVTVKLPSSSGFAPTATGSIGIDTALNRLVVGINSVSKYPVFADTTDTFTNKSFNAGASGNVLQINGQTVNSVSGNASKVGLVTGSPAANDCAKFDASGNLTTAGGACTTSAGASAIWSSLTNPVADESVSMSTFQTAFTWTDRHDVPSWSMNMGQPTTSPTINLVTIFSGTNDTNLGSLFDVHTGTSSTSRVVQFHAKGTANGVYVDTSGLVQADGTGGVAAASLTGTIAKARMGTAVFTDQANTYSSGLQDLTSVTMKVPNSAGAAPTSSADLRYDTTGNVYVGGVNGNTRTFEMLELAQTVTGNKTYGAGILRATSPRITTSLFDANGLPMLSLSPTGSATVNFQMSNDIDAGTPTLSATAPAQGTSSKAGTNLGFTAGGAVAGSSSAGAAAGGALNFATGAAARLTSGNANGGQEVHTFGAGIGTGIAGYMLLNQNGIGATSTDVLTGSNTTGAAAGAQQWSPRMHLIGQGWKTNSTAASQQVEWYWEAQPVQGAANPSVNLVFSSVVNGAAPVMGLTLASGTPLTNSSGLVLFTSISTPDGARAYHNADQAIANATYTAVSLNSERYNNGSVHSTVTNDSRLTAQRAGNYLITASVLFAANSSGSFRYAEIRLNGSGNSASTNIAATNFLVNGSQQNYGTLSTVYHLSANDYVELVIYQDSGGNLNIQSAGNYSPEFSIQYLGP